MAAKVAEFALKATKFKSKISINFKTECSV